MTAQSSAQSAQPADLLGGLLGALALATRRLPPGPLTERLEGMVLRWLVGRTRPRLVATQVLGCSVELDPSELVDCALLLFPQTYDTHEIAFLRGRLRPGDVFLDAGAHIGLYTLPMARVVGPAGRVVAVEPNPRTYRRLERHVALNGLANVTALPLGLSDREEALELTMTGGGNSAASTFFNVPLKPHTQERVAVACKPLRQVLQEAGVRKLHAAKFDIEGFEHRVLARYLEDAPRDQWPEHLVVEYHPAWVPLTGDAVALLVRHGYREVGRFPSTGVWNYALSLG